MKTENIHLSDMWHDGKYKEVADLITEENWSHSDIVNLSLYFVKFVGTRDLRVLMKLL